MKKSVYLTIGLIWMTSSLSAQDGPGGVVIGVIDGNTMRLVINYTDTIKVALDGVDCPELGQDHSSEAMHFTSTMCLGKVVSLRFSGKDRLGNHKAVVFAPDGTDVRVALLENGLAWTAEKNPDAALEGIRLNARQNGYGLWKAKQPVSPWQYRRQQSMLTPKSR